MTNVARIFIFCALLAAPAAAAGWPPPATPPTLPGALGYTILPTAAYNPDPKHTYKVVFDVTHGGAKPTDASMAIVLAATELDQMRGHGVPKDRTKFALVFHGDAINSILNSATYKAKFGIDNPNLPILAGLKAQGVELLVCGQYLAITKTDPATLSSDIVLGSDALVMLVTFQNMGYALLSF